MQTKAEATNAVTELFARAYSKVVTDGHFPEIEWQRRRSFDSTTESAFLREAAWVVLNSGFREAIVRKHFGYISLCFCDWDSAEEITTYREQCVSTAGARFKNFKKLEAIAEIARIISDQHFSCFKSKILQDPIRNLQELPFIGPVTSWHLAKNLGLEVAKNDRHLARLAREFGFSDAHKLCENIAQKTGERVSVIDTVLWRYCTLSSPRNRTLH